MRAGNALSLASAARASGQTSTAYVLRADGTHTIPTDALGIAPMMAGGVGVDNGTVFWNQIFMSQVRRGMGGAYSLACQERTHAYPRPGARRSLTRCA